MATAELARAFAERLRPVLASLDGMSARAAARELERRGIETARGDKWTAGLAWQRAPGSGCHDARPVSPRPHQRPQRDRRCRRRNPVAIDHLLELHDFAVPVRDYEAIVPAVVGGQPDAEVVIEADQFVAEVVIEVDEFVEVHCSFLVYDCAMWILGNVESIIFLAIVAAMVALAALVLLAG